MTTLLIVLVCLVALLAAVYVFMVWPNLPRRPIPHLTGFDYAHRGLWNDEFPENSLPAFAHAAELGFGIELDVHLTRDGVPVVLHDDVMTRMTGDSRNIHDCTLAELRALRLKGTEYGLPTFREVLDTVAGRVPMIVELKTGPRVPELCEKTRAMLRDYGGPYCIESFDPAAVRWWRKNAPEIIRGVLSCSVKDDPREDLTLLKRLMPSLMQDLFARPDFIAYRHEDDRNLPMALMRLLRPTLVAWTVRSQQDMDRLRGRYDLQIFERFIPKR